MRIIRALCLAVAAVLLGSLASAQAADPFTGTWKLNIAKSQFPGPPPAMAYILTFEPRPDGSVMSMVYDVDAAGGRIPVGRLVFRYDGRDYHEEDAKTGVPSPDALAFSRIDPRTVGVEQKVGTPQRVYKEIRRVAADGRTMTFSLTAASRPGQTVTILQVFDRQ